MPETIPLPTPRRRRLLSASAGLLLLTYLGFISLGLPDGAFGVAWPFLRADFELTQRAFGAVLLCTGVGFLSSSLFAGTILRLVGAGTLLAGSTAIVAVGLVGYALAPVFPLLLLAAFVAGFGGGAIDSGLNGYAAGHYSARQMTWLHAAFGLGAGLGPLAMTLALGLSGWRLGYAIIAAVMISMAILFTATRRGFAAEVRATASGPVAPVREVVRLPLVWLQVAAFFVYTGVELAAGQWAFAVLSGARGYSVEAAGLWVSAYWGALFAGRVLLGFGADAIGPDRLIRAGAIGALVGTIIFAADPAGLGPVGLVLIGFSVAPIYPMMMHRTPTVLGSAVAPQAIGFQVSAAMVGSVAIPGATGFVAASFGLDAAPVVIAASAVVMLALIEAILRTPAPNRAAS